ncbi:hypothetical protein BHU72_10970 [Desulfuribacillus stibiiarsenatis]|uniref:Uncharacterized protein n=1 Tax=Desulfuribacillus stibiiarsenatis TaxID=1390249 RepID=A0A1E5L307_9FIRM|nr:hypothetical protein [Desulfuribacillus stibiiarsenatis]OEH84319.1 hypothetical protein BHU72_10970 [Desulfuribacillus stibiiarsenatis]
MKPFYKAWHVLEIVDPSDWTAKKPVLKDKLTICYVEGIDAKVVTVYTNFQEDFPSIKAEEALWDIFGEPCLYLSNEDFQDFVDSWKMFQDLQSDFWSKLVKEKKHRVNVSLMRKSFITAGAYKLFQSHQSSKHDKWSEEKLDVLGSLLYDVFKELQGVRLTVWGLNIHVVEYLENLGIIVSAVNLEDSNNKRQQLIESADGADGLMILSDCSKVKEASLQPVLEQMKQKYIFDACYIYEISEIEKLGARLLYC